MTKFTHNGVEITFSSSGDFVATVNGKFVRKPSLKAMKDCIDKAAKAAFNPIKALVRPAWYGKANVKGVDLCRVDVVDIVTKKKRYGTKVNTLVIRTDTGKQEETYEAWRDCPEAIAARKAWEEYQKETERIEEQRKKVNDELWDKLEAFKLNPDDFLKSKE